VFREYEHVAVLGVPNVVVRKLVHVHVQGTIVLEDVGHEQMYEGASMPLRAENAAALYIIRNVEVPHPLIPTNSFLI
jgi:hypothetical protein